MDLKTEWENLLIDNIIAENHYWIGGYHMNLKISEVESIIVSGLLIRAISLLDFALEIYIDNNNIEIQNRNPKLFNRLKALNDRNILVDPDSADLQSVPLARICNPIKADLQSVPTNKSNNT